MANDAAEKVNVNWFFLSYARLDRETAPKDQDYIKSFYEDLRRNLLQMKPQAGEVGFFDDKGISHGSAWQPTLNQALATCRVLICVYSPAYFISEYCGKEFQIFRTRLDDLQPGGGMAAPPPLILP